MKAKSGGMECVTGLSIPKVHNCLEQITLNILYDGSMLNPPFQMSSSSSILFSQIGSEVSPLTSNSFKKGELYKETTTLYQNSSPIISAFGQILLSRK